MWIHLTGLHVFTCTLRVHSRSRGCFVRTHTDDTDRSVYLSNRFDKPELQAVAPPPVKADGKVCTACCRYGGGVDS